MCTSRLTVHFVRNCCKVHVLYMYIHNIHTLAQLCMKTCIELAAKPWASGVLRSVIKQNSTWIARQKS